MEEKEVVALLRHYRHELMNHLQIIHGYASMGKTDKVLQKLEAYTNHLQEESKLVHLNAPFFVLHILQLSTLHTNVRLTYDIGVENKDFQTVDHRLVECSQQIIEIIKKTIDDQTLYDVTMQLYDISEDTLELAFIVNGLSSERPNWENINEEVMVYEQENSVTYMMTIPYERGG